MGIAGGLVLGSLPPWGSRGIWGHRSQVSSCDYIDPMQDPLALQKGRAGPELEKFWEMEGKAVSGCLFMLIMPS